MSEIETTGTTLEDRLRSEQRHCPQCRLKVINPLIGRCPRCDTPLPIVDPGCQGCLHRTGCPAHQEFETMTNKRRRE